MVKMAEELGITRPEGWKHHQAGHDSMLIGKVFWKIKERFGISEECFIGAVHGAEPWDLVAVATPPPSSIHHVWLLKATPSQGMFYSPI